MVSRFNRFIVIITCIILGCLSCSESVKNRNDEDAPKEESNKFIDVSPESVTYKLSEGKSIVVTTSVPTAIGHYSFHFGDNNEQPISETFFERSQQVVIVNPIGTDYFQLERKDDMTYAIEMLPISNPGPVSLRIRFYPLSDKSYLFGELYIKGE